MKEGTIYDQSTLVTATHVKLLTTLTNICNHGTCYTELCQHKHVHIIMH